MIRVIVERKRWMRGTGNGKLLGQNGKMCCIGFLARRLGCAPKDIRDIGTLVEVESPKTAQFSGSHQEMLEAAYNANDDEGVTDITREKELKQVGKKMGVQFVFKG